MQNSSDMIQTKSEQTKGFTTMFFDFNRFLRCNPFTGDMAPAESYGQHSYQFADAFGKCHVSIFKIETTTFKALKKCFDAPAFLIIVKNVFSFFIGYKNKVFTAGQQHSDNIDRLTVNYPPTSQCLVFTGLQISEQSPGGNQYTLRIAYHKIIFDTHNEVNAVFQQKGKPVSTDEFTITEKTFYFFNTEYINETFYQFNTFFPMKRIFSWIL